VPASEDNLLAIFDHDGVLVDSFELHEQAWLELERRTKLGFTTDFIHKTFGMTNPSIFRALLGDGITEDDIRRYADLKEECYRDVARGKIKLIEGMRELLDNLTARRVKLAIGSSGPLANLELTVRECGLTGRFAAISSLEDITRGKPDPQVFLVAAAKAGCAPAHSVVFEDAPVGIQAGKAAGMYTVALTTTHPRTTLEEVGPDEVIETVVGYGADALVRRLRTRPAR
jgi:HAD superfamily hydrolase (TIGR01509 family)